MVVAKETLVGMHYTLTDEYGSIFETTVGSKPFYYFHGVGSMIPGIERETEGMKPGDVKHLFLSPNDGYGEREADHVLTLPIDLFDEPDGLRVGMRIRINFDDKTAFFTVLKKSDDEITLDGNHPLAGFNLSINIEIVSVREATNQEADNNRKESVTMNSRHSFLLSLKEAV